MTTERERFEAWAKTTHPRWRFDKSRSDDGYMYAPTATAWRAWQAAVSRAQPAAPSVAPEPVAWRWSESNGERWFDWTADWTHHDRAKSLGYRVEYAHPPRAPLTEEFWLMLDTALDALKYHQEQTRPIELTRVTIAAVETFISAHGIGGK